MRFAARIGLALILLSCGDGQVRRLSLSHSQDLSLLLHQSETHCQIVNEDLDIGSFLSKDSEGQLISVVRDQNTSQTGLVQIDPESLDLKVLDESASKAMDIKISEDSIAYRLEESVKFLAAGKPEELLSAGVSKLMAFEQTSKSLLLQVQNMNGGFDWVCFNQDHQISAGASSEDRILSIAHDAQDRQWIALESSDGIYLQKNSLCLDTDSAIYRPKLKYRTEHAKLMVIDKQAFLSFLNMENGNFELLIFNLDSEVWSHEIIDGAAYQNYLGMDIDAQVIPRFERPIYLYLDAWKLEPKLAIFYKGKWKTSHIGIGGSSGFYNQILSIDENKMKIAFRSFRNAMSTGRSSFENLVLCEIDFKPMVDTKNAQDKN